MGNYVTATPGELRDRGHLGTDLVTSAVAMAVATEVTLV